MCIICFCQHNLRVREWEAVCRGRLVSELLTEVQDGHCLQCSLLTAVKGLHLHMHSSAHHTQGTQDIVQVSMHSSAHHTQATQDIVQVSVHSSAHRTEDTQYIMEVSMHSSAHHTQATQYIVQVSMHSSAHHTQGTQDIVQVSEGYLPVTQGLIIRMTVKL